MFKDTSLGRRPLCRMVLAFYSNVLADMSTSCLREAKVCFDAIDKPEEKNVHGCVEKCAFQTCSWTILPCLDSFFCAQLEFLAFAGNCQEPAVHQGTHFRMYCVWVEKQIPVSPWSRVIILQAEVPDAEVAFSRVFRFCLAVIHFEWHLSVWAIWCSLALLDQNKRVLHPWRHCCSCGLLFRSGPEGKGGDLVAWSCHNSEHSGCSFRAHLIAHMRSSFLQSTSQGPQITGFSWCILLLKILSFPVQMFRHATTVLKRTGLTQTQHVCWDWIAVGWVLVVHARELGNEQFIFSEKDVTGGLNCPN